MAIRSNSKRNKQSNYSVRNSRITETLSKFFPTFVPNFTHIPNTKINLI